MAAHVAFMVGVLWVFTAAGSRLFPLKWFVWAGYAGLSTYLLVSAAYSAGVVSDLIEYLYLGYPAQTVSASSALTASLHALNRLVDIRVNFVPVAVVAAVAVPVVVTAVFSDGAGLPYGLLSYHLMVAGFAFYVFILYFCGVLGRFSQRLSLVTAHFSMEVEFAGVAALYLYVTGRYLSGTSVFTLPIFLSSLIWVLLGLLQV
jgi:hypothetical protein